MCYRSRGYQAGVWQFEWDPITLPFTEFWANIGKFVLIWAFFYYYFPFISLALFLQAKNSKINLIWLWSRHAPFPHKSIWSHADVLKQSEPRVEPILVSLSEGNWISMFLWRENQLCKVLKVLPSKTGSQNWILLLAEHENMLSHKKMKHFLCEKCVTLLISFFTLSPTPALNSVWWYIWLVVLSLYMMMFWGLIQLNPEAACWPLKNFCFLLQITSKA